MELINWINKNLSEISDTVLYSKYFDSIIMEQGIDDFTLFTPQLGIDLILRQDYSILAIHLYSGNQKGTKQFIDDLPYNLNFSLSQKETRKILGTPSTVGGGDYSMLYGTAPPWDRYEHESFYFHLQFLPDASCIDLVTIFSL